MRCCFTFLTSVCVYPSGVLWKHGSLLHGAESPAAANCGAVPPGPASGMAHTHRHTPGTALVHEQMHLTG